MSERGEMGVRQDSQSNDSQYANQHDLEGFQSQNIIQLFSSLLNISDTERVFVYSGFIIIDNQPHPWSTLTSSQSLYWSSLRMFVASSHRREIWDGGKLCATNIFSVNEDDGMWNLWCSWRKRIFDEKLGRKKKRENFKVEMPETIDDVCTNSNRN